MATAYFLDGPAKGMSMSVLDEEYLLTYFQYPPLALAERTGGMAEPVQTKYYKVNGSSRNGSIALFFSVIPYGEDGREELIGEALMRLWEEATTPRESAR